MCDKCTQFFETENKLTTHKLKYNDTRIITCLESNKVFTGLKQLRDHKGKHLVFQCPKYNKQVNKFNKSRYIKSCDQSSCLVCDVCGCGYETEKNSLFTKHMKPHQNCICSECGFRCKDQADLNKHKDESHKKSCQYCE